MSVHKQSQITVPVVHIFGFLCHLVSKSTKDNLVSAEKVALAALVRFYSKMTFYVSSQMACLNRCIVALVAFKWFLSFVNFHMCPQSSCPSRGKVALLDCIYRISLHSEFSSASSNCLPKQMHSCIGCT